MSRLMQPGRVLAQLLQAQRPAATAVVGSRRSASNEATFEVKACRLHKLDQGPSTSATVTRDEALLYYRQMVTIRRMEAAAATLYQEKVIRGFCHLYSGQEAVAVGMKAAMRDQDSCISSYRVHGWTYLMGVSAFSVLAELAGRRSGCARGKGGSMHLYTRNFYGGNGIVGAQVPLGVGVAFANKYLGNDGVNFALYGDGAANQGQIFEVYNMAKLWNLPAVFVCENNGYGMGTSVERASASVTYYTRGDFVPGILVDGMDVLASREATKFAIDHCVSGKGPLVMEMATYRYSGHSMSDPGTSYRTRDEIQEVRQTRDPISHFKEKMISSGLATADEIKDMEIEIKKEMEDAAKKTRSDPEIPLSEIAADIYALSYEPEIRGNLPINPYKHANLAKPINM